MNKKIIWFIIGIVVLVLIIVGVSRKSSMNSGSNYSDSRPLKIGAILPLTGPVASAGEYAKHGIEQALADMAKHGKTPNMQVVFEDGQYDSKVSVAAYNKLKTIDKVDALLVFSSPSAMPLAPLVNADHIPMIGLVTAPAYSSPDDYTFRNVASGDDTSKLAADILIDRLGKKKLAVMYLNNEYGTGAVKVFEESVGSRAKIVASEGAPVGSTDFHTQLVKIKSSSPDAIFMPMAYKDAGLFVKQAKELGIQAVFLGDQPVDSPDFISTAGTAAEGVLVIAPVATSNNGDFEKEYTQKYGKAPSYLSLRMYDSTNIYSAIAKKCEAKSYSGGCLKDELYALKDFPGVAFPISFDHNGNIRDQLIIKIVKDGAFTIYK